MKIISVYVILSSSPYNDIYNASMKIYLLVKKTERKGKINYRFIEIIL